jgi:hypothetical protein
VLRLPQPQEEAGRMLERLRTALEGLQA